MKKKESKNPQKNLLLSSSAVRSAFHVPTQTPGSASWTGRRELLTSLGASYPLFLYSCLYSIEFVPHLPSLPPPLIPPPLYKPHTTPRYMAGREGRTPRRNDLSNSRSDPVLPTVASAIPRDGLSCALNLDYRRSSLFPGPRASLYLAQLLVFPLWGPSSLISLLSATFFFAGSWGYCPVHPRLGMAGV